MAINGLGQNYYQNNNAALNRYANNNNGENFSAAVTKVSFGKGNQVTIDPNALFSICDAATGESANVYRAEGYSEDNPLYLVKGVDENGQEYEQTVDVSKVNPNHCSYRELLALNAHTGNKSDSNFLTMSVLKDKAKNASYETKTDYLSIAYDLMKEMKTAGYWDSYMRYDKWISDILNVNQNKMTTWYKGTPLVNGITTDPKYTDSETGISWYVRDGRQPYMTEEDARKLKNLCEETGEPWLKKFAEMTGTIQHLDDNTVAYIGDNGTVIKSKDGKELVIDTSALSYDMLMNLFRNLPKTNNYFNSGYWAKNVQKAFSII